MPVGPPVALNGFRRANFFGKGPVRPGESASCERGRHALQKRLKGTKNYFEKNCNGMNTFFCYTNLI